MISGINSRRALSKFVNDGVKVPSSLVQTGGITYTEKLYNSRFKFLPAMPIKAPPEFDADMRCPTYAQIQADILALETDFPDKVTKDLMGYSVNGLPIYGLRINDDGVKPIVGFSNGIHGNERNCHWGLFHLLRRMLDDNDSLRHSDPVIAAALEELTIFVAPTVNPDAMSYVPATITAKWDNTGKRTNQNDINLNRDWPYYWKINEVDKTGTAGYFSQPETAAFDTWFQAHGLGQRVHVWWDLHAWYSQDNWGFLIEQHYNDPDGLGQQAHRGCYLNFQAHLEARDWGDVFPQWESGRPPKATESRSSRKAYLYTYVKNLAHPAAICGILEYPQIEWPGAHATVAMDLIRSSFITALDIKDGGADGTRMVKAAVPHNAANNPIMSSWNATENRPAWHSVTGLELTYHAAAGDEPEYIESFRPLYDVWPDISAPGQQFALIETTVPPLDEENDYDEYQEDGSENPFWLIGGYDDGGQVATMTMRDIFYADTNSGPSLPGSRQYGACSTDQNDIFFFGGRNDTTFYFDEIYKIDALDPTSWVLHDTMPTATQRHCAIYWKNNDHIIFGGRDAVGYLDTVWKWNSVTKTWTNLATLPDGIGWASCCIRNDVLWVFGGWDGLNVENTVTKVDLNTGVVTAAANPLPAVRCEMAIAVKGDVAYLINGRDASLPQSTIYAYDMATETVSTVTYTMGLWDEDNDGIYIPLVAPKLISHAAYYNEFENKIVICGGEHEDGLVKATVYELDMGTLVMDLMTDKDSSWGYIRSNLKWNCVPGETYTIVCRLRNGAPVSQYRNPYARLTCVVGPLSDVSRRIRTGYTVPPQDEFRDYSITFTAQPDETEFRVYIRHYGGNTRLHFNYLGIFLGAPDLITPTEAAGITARTGTSTPVSNFKNDLPNKSKLEGIFSPHCTNQMAGSSINCLDFTLTGGMTHIGIDFVPLADYSAPLNPTASFGSQKFDASAKFTLNYTIGGVSNSIDFFEGVEINHNNIIRAYRRDKVDWKLETGPLKSNGFKDLILTIGFYGKVFRKVFVLNQETTCTSYTHGSGQTISL